MLQARAEIARVVHEDPVARELYDSWYRRVEPKGHRKFSISDTASFCLLAAASGIVGNFAYDALKALLRKFAGGRATSCADMVTEREYEALRERLNSGTQALIEVDERTQLLIRRRHLILVRMDTLSDLEADDSAT